MTDELTGNKNTLKDDLVKWGLKPEMFHDDWRTEYPSPKGVRFSDSNRRMLAIENWMEKNGDADWIAFDDEPFFVRPTTEHYRRILIDFDRGIDYTAYRQAAKVFGFRQEPKLITL